VAELVDAPDLGSGDESRGGSSPSARTIIDARLSARIVADWVISVSAARSAGSRGFWFFTGRV
jgi:hypothetical protein